MMFKKLVFIKAVLMNICIFTVMTYNADDLKSAQQDLELKRRESAFSEQIQSQLQRKLSDYYKSDTFIINIKTHLERIPEKLPVVKTAAKQKNETESDLRLPALPVSQSYGKSGETARQTDEQWMLSERYKIKYLDVSVLTDKEIFKNEDINFVEKVIKMHQDIDPIRGDRVSVVPLSFPVQAGTVIAGDIPVAAGILGEMKPYVYYAAAGALFLLLLIVTLQLLSLKKTKNTAHRNYAYGTLPQYGKEGLSQDPVSGMLQAPPKTQVLPMLNESSLSAAGKSQAKESPRFEEKMDDEANKDIFYELRQLMVTTLIGNPELSGAIFKKWTEANNDEDIYKLAAFFRATDPKLIEFLSEYLGKELTAKVEFAMNQIQSMDKDSLSEIFKKFREEFQNEQSAIIMKKKAEGESGDMFNFLKQLSAHQMFQLVKDEPIGIIAVVLAQVPPEQANEVISNLPQENKLRLPVEIGKLKRIPIASYGDIAKKLSKKAIELDKIKYVKTDGINTLVEMLDQSPPELEEEILASVAVQDISLAEELRKIYITFDELPKLPDRVCSGILRNINRDDIVKALVNAKEEVKEKILNNLPPRTKVMVSDALESDQTQIPIEEISRARHSITRIFRDMAKNREIDLEKLVTT
ncbi:FliG C-terminal domain-containing protein [Elusimicrobiota bacterium]